MISGHRGGGEPHARPGICEEQGRTDDPRAATAIRANTTAREHHPCGLLSFGEEVAHVESTPLALVKWGGASAGAGGAGGGLLRRLIAFTSKRRARRITKSEDRLDDAPYLSSTGLPAGSVPMRNARSVKSTAAMGEPSGGMMMSPTRDEMMRPNAAPITTPTARSMALPLTANSLICHLRPMLLSWCRRRSLSRDTIARPLGRGQSGEAATAAFFLRRGFAGALVPSAARSTSCISAILVQRPTGAPVPGCGCTRPDVRETAVEVAAKGSRCPPCRAGGRRPSRRGGAVHLGEGDERLDDAAQLLRGSVVLISRAAAAIRSSCEACRADGAVRESGGQS